MKRTSKLIAAFLQDIAEQLNNGELDLCPEMVGEIITLLSKLEKKTTKEEKSITEKAADDIMEKRKEDMTPEECLACELANMLGIGGDLTSPGEFPMSSKPTIKIKIKKVSSKDDLNKILKELKNGGNLDLNTMNDSLGEIFDLNSIQEIMETPMFKQGGQVISDNQITNDQTTLEDFLNE